MGNKETCDHNEAAVSWRPEDVTFDEHQAIVPGTCSNCGMELEYVYNEAGIRQQDNSRYVREF